MMEPIQHGIILTMITQKNEQKSLIRQGYVFITSKR